MPASAMPGTALPTMQGALTRRKRAAGTRSSPVNRAAHRRSRRPIERSPAGREQFAPTRPVEVSEHAVGRHHGHRHHLLALDADDRQRRHGRSPGDLGVDAGILRREADDGRDQLDQPRSAFVRGVVVDDPRQATQQGVRALRPVSPAFAGQVGRHLHEAGALLRAAVLAKRELGTSAGTSSRRPNISVRRVPRTTTSLPPSRPHASRTVSTRVLRRPELGAIRNGSQ